MNITLKEKILTEIKENNLSVFCAKDFIHLGDGKSINKSLERLTTDNIIQRVITGVFYAPKYIEIIDDYESPNIHEVAKTLARKNNWSITPTGNIALNKLGLSTQVPSKYIYLSSGPYKKYKIFNTDLAFKRTNNREVLKYSEETNLVIQALKAIGREKVTDEDISMISSKLDDSKKNVLLKESRSTSIWIYELIKKICGVNTSV